MGRSRAQKRARPAAPIRRPEPKPVNPKDAKLRIDSWEDVANEEDAFHLERDKVLLDDDGRGDHETDSEEEVMTLDVPETDEDESDQEDKSRVVDGKDDDDDDDDEKSTGEAEEDMEEGWGTSKSEYYGADEAENEEDAAAEEAEALRIQRKHMDAMSAADFFDEDAWDQSVDSAPTGTAAKVVEVLPKTVDVESLSPEERLKILHARHPEFEGLRKEFLALQDTHQKLEQNAKAAEAEGRNMDTSNAIRKWAVLSAYLGCLAMYFAVLTSDKAQEAGGAYVKEHPVMEGLFSCRQMWERVRKLEEAPLSLDAPKPSIAKAGGEKKRKRPLQADEAESRGEDEEEAEEAAAALSKPKRAKKARKEPDFSDLDALTASIRSKKSVSKKASKTVASNSTRTVDGLDAADFGEDEVLNAIDAEEKSARRRGLRFYASQIVSKSTKRAAAGRDRGGDDDVPHKERRKERELRLQREAAKRMATAGADLNDEDPDDNDHQVAKKVNGGDSDLEYYNMVANASKKRKEDKKALYEAKKAAEKEGATLKVTEGEIGPDGKRAIGWTIQKNKGLTPHRKKDVRNPRVKKKKAYDKAKKKLGSTKQIYKGGPQGNYGGEATGINANVVRSVKFNS